MREAPKKNFEFLGRCEAFSWGDSRSHSNKPFGVEEGEGDALLKQMVALLWFFPLPRPGYPAWLARQLAPDLRDSDLGL